jgi:hypothetical protein
MNPDIDSHWIGFNYFFFTLHGWIAIAIPVSANIREP